MVAGRPPPSFCSGPMPKDCDSKEKPSEPGYFPSFVNNLVTPFVSCWQPPINSCVTPSRPTRQRQPMPLQLPDQQQQKTNIHEPHPNDVLCGRGGSSNRHIGNLNFRSLVAANKEMYVTLTKKQKMIVARKIVETIHMQDPPGRFLQKDSHTGLWFDIGVPRSLEKTSQALREKTPSTSETSKPGKSTPVSPGGSSVTAATSATEETYPDVVSEVGISSPVIPKSSPLTPTASPQEATASSPVSAVKSDASSSNEVPAISIPEHLESQFHPPRRMETRTPHVQPRWNHEYPPIPPQHNTQYPPPGPMSQPYPGPPYPRNPPPPPPPPDYYRHPQHRIPYSPQYPPSGFDRHKHRQHAGPPPPPYRQPSFPKFPPQHVSSSANRVPPSPDQKLFQVTSTAAPSSCKTLDKRFATPERSGSKGGNSKASGTVVRETTEVSPGRAQAWKKRRTVPEEASLTDDLGNRLSLKENGELKSPSGVLQSRSRREIAKDTKRGNGSDVMSGLAALSSAALLKLDEGGEKS